MIQTTALKREERGNPYAGLPPPDTVRDQTKQVSEISDLLVEYEEFLNKEIDFNQIEKIIEKETILLTPDKIDNFLQQTILYENHKNYEENTGAFISQLIQTSYNAGNNNFELNTDDLKKIDYIAAFLQGKEKNPIIIKIEGNTRDNCGYETLNCNFNIKGNTRDHFGSSSQNSIFNIKGNTAYNCGFISKNSIFNIEGNTGDDCGYETLNCNFNIKGNTENYCGNKSQNSTFNIEGNTGNNCGNETQNCNFTIKGNTGYESGKRSYNSTFNIQGNADSHLGINAKSSIFNLEGDAKERCGYESNDSTFNIKGDIESWCCQEAKNNTYITHNIKSYQMVIRESSENNTIFLTNNSGNILDYTRK